MIPIGEVSNKIFFIKFEHFTLNCFVSLFNEFIMLFGTGLCRTSQDNK